MTIDLQKPGITELKPRITVFGVGGGGGNAVNNMINTELEGVEFVVANTDAQSLSMSRAKRLVQLGVTATAGLGAGSNPEIGRAAAEECIDEIGDHLGNSHMVFVTCGMGGGTGTGAAPVIARAARERGLLTIGVVTKPFNFEGPRRMKLANAGIEELQKNVDTLIVIPNQNLFRIINESTTLVDAFAMADQVLYSGVASITDLMVREGLINLDFADVRSVMLNMGRAMMGTGEASGDGRAMAAAEAAIANPLLDETSMHGARGLLISITGGRDMTLNEVDVAATRVRDEVDPDANVIFGAIVDEALEGFIRVSVVATGIDNGGEAGTQIPVIDTNNMGGIPVSAKKPETPAQILTSAPLSESSTTSAEMEFNVDAIEALEEEMAESLEDAFRPQSQIFASPAARRETAREALPHNPSSSQLSSPSPASQINMSDAGSMAAEHIRPRVAASGAKVGIGSVDVVAGGAGGSDVQGESASRVPSIEDFPPVIQQVAGRKMAAAEEVGHGPRRLWQKLTQGFIQRDEDEPVMRLEPAEIIPDSDSVGQKEDTAVASVRSVSPRTGAQSFSPASPQARPDIFQRLSRATPQPQRREPVPVPMADFDAEEEQLEIPSFLRRQVN